MLANNKQLEMIAKKSNIELDSIKYILKNNLDIPEKLQKQLLVQGAAVVIDSKHGNILAMIGGRSDYLDQYNRSTQALRQPGSVFKPYIYTAAIDNNFLPNNKILFFK